MLSLQNAPDAAVSPSSPLAIHPFEVDNPSAKFDLVFGFSSSAEGLRGVINFGTGLFREDSVRRMAVHLRVLLEAAVLSPDSPLAHLPLLPPDERQTLLLDWNQAAAPVADEACVHELFGAQALRTPGAQALAFEGQHLTYLQLHQRSNQLAHALRSMGVGPEVPVALCMERSLELVVAVLGVLKAGGAYVPLDPAYPAQRLAFMLRDCQAPVLLTQPHLRSLLPAHDGHVLVLDEALLAPWPTTAPASETTADNLAYVIYTSGSTGTPKGVWVPHRGIVRLVQGSAYMRFGPEETFLQLASISFDASTFELWGALLHGARLVIFPPQTPSLQELARFISSHAISTLFLTTALFDQMMAQHPEALDGVRQLLTGGEINPVHRFRQRLERGKSIIAAYGPTENTTFSTCFPLSSVEQVGASVSLGRPIANTTAYVLDHHLRPVPAGVPGELFVGGAGLARGYLGRPELTAERFIPHPFSDTPGARLYRTGDKARWRADGTLEFLGRVDFQVKLRGFRIELGEVESALRAHPGVEDAVAVVREEMPGDKRLVAYVVASLPSQATPETLRAHLRQHLPEYMVPSAFVLLPALPLTANGKVNRQSLPAPDGRASSAAGAYVAPRDSTERQLAAIWAEVLKLERVGVTDDFFALGAHSLLAIQVVSRIRAAFGVDLPLRTLFEKPNIEALARALAPPDADGLQAGGMRGEAPAQLDPVRPTRFGRAEGPTSMAQSRWLGYAGPNRPRGQGNVPQCVRLTGRLDVGALEQALSTLLERHEVLRTHFVRTGEGFGFKVSPAAPFRLERLDFSGLLPEQREEALRQRVYQDASLPFDLMAPPMFRAWLYILGPAEHVLLLLTHHIAWDGWSQAILFQEVSLAYQAYARGQTPQLPESRLQYSDFAWWQHEHLRGAYLESVQSYWRKQLAGGVTMVDFPLDKPRPATRSYSTLSATAHFPGELSAALKALCQREGATLYMLAMAAYQALLALRSGVRDVTVFSNVGGRDHFEVENLIGCFTNIVLIRTNLEGDPTFRELLTRVREGVLGALAHSALPYHRVLEMIGQHPDSASARTFPGLNLQSFQRSGAPSAEAGELQLERVNIPLGGGLLANMFFFISEEADHRVSVMAQANGDLYEALTVERILEDYQRLMEVACAEPDRRLSSLLSPGART
jgi:amino acid adenylation domain-containing protein